MDGGADADDDVLSGRAAADSTTLESSLLSDMSGTASVLGDTSNMSTNDLQALAAERAAQDEREQAATVLARAKRKRDDAASGTADLLSLSPSSVASFISARGMVTTEELMRAAKPLLRTDEDLRRFPVTVKRVATMEVVDGVNYLRATQ